ncbi:TIGR04283 family arsenosugar biosynthesis glycosyltransferase [Crateriforma conspicua]|uniref:PGL/p-HBAD biosynthesis glycosyltransferase n=1 Tax=Crateriforma conspicua TaxID=2527996 RepID=A0A5C6FUK3_9PLAN|nr:TIGR04283 family arsenosugar biosynthesis glycosyltransferase [Crateriforma conspicua]TWU64803.1 PGL/p-HBAD biosynthesis glycosyltransferase [Crateriforma conspicua]
MKPDEISIVIPALNEADHIAPCIDSALAAGATEIIVSDGGSTDATASIARQSGAGHVIRSLPGRGIQMNSGSVFARGKAILFLHADSRLGNDTLDQICRLDDEWVWGACRQRIESSERIYRWIESGNAARVRWMSMAFGDQAIFVRRNVFKSVGGFSESPLMEDVELSRRLRSRGRPKLIDGPVITSARRWQNRGPVRQTLLNWRIQIAYKLGVAPETLADWYRGK